LEKAISKVPNFDKTKDQIEMTITPEGLRIELLESEIETFFQIGNSAPNDKGKALLSLWRKNGESFPTMFPSKVIPIPSPTRAAANTGIGSSRASAPTRPDD
jgi:chemotaxis protein MotB